MNKRIEYDEKLIAFIDILGFTNIVNNRYQDDAKSIRTILRHFREILKDFPEKLSYDKKLFRQFRIRFFSDLIILTIPIRRSNSKSFLESLHTMTWWIAISQTFLIRKGILIRGSIHKGNIFDREDFIFGPGFIKAYELEHVKAKYPIVILSDDVIKYLELNKNTINDYSYYQEIYSNITNIFHDSHYVNYLQHNYNSFGPKDYFKLLLKHKQIIQSGLEEYLDFQNEYQKYNWLKTYHNYRVRFGIHNIDSIDNLIIK